MNGTKQNQSFVLSKAIILLAYDDIKGERERERLRRRHRISTRSHVFSSIVYNIILKYIYLPI